MPVIATDTTTLSNLLKHEYRSDIAYCRTEVTYNGAAKSFAIGDLVKTDGAAPAAAGEVYGVVIGAVSAPLNTATKVLVLFRGPLTLSKAGITLGGLSGSAAAVYAALEGKGMQVLDAV